jgi:hypothetical protein
MAASEGAGGVEVPDTAAGTLKKKVLAARQARAEGRLTAEDFKTVNLQVRAAARRPIVLADPDPTDDVIIFDFDPTDAIIVIGV